MIADGRPAGKARWMWAGAAAVACVTVAVVAVAFAARSRSAPTHSTAIASASATSVSGAVACAVGEPACDRQVADLARRAVLTSVDQRAAQDAFTPVAQAVTAESAGCSGAACTKAIPAIRHTLEAAGYRDVAVRVADGGDDIAPDGSLITAVGVGPACVLVLQGATGQMSGSFAGRLPDGSCLTA